MRTEDGYIIRKCLSGESAAFGLLVDKYKAGIYALAYYKLQDFHDAEDITQEAFIKAYKNLHNLRNWDSFLAWLYSITSNLCSNFIRTRNQRPDSEFIEDQTPEDLDTILINAYKDDAARESFDEIEAVINRAMKSLPEAYQRILTLYYLGGMDSAQIARFTGTSPTIIRKRLSRARSELKDEVLSIMNAEFKQQREQRMHVSFTFRIVETIKRVKIHPVSQARNLPWGLSLAAGVIITAILSFTSPSIQYRYPSASSNPLHSIMKVLKTGEISVDILEKSNKLVISSQKVDKSKEDHESISPEKEEKTSFQSIEGKWVKKADMPTRRHSVSACVVNGKIYVIGGGRRPIDSKGTYEYFGIVEKYDPTADTWMRKAIMPTPRMSFSTIAVDGKVYAIGGGNNWNKSYSAMEEYDPENDIWTTRASMPTARSCFGTAVFDGKILVMGGITDKYHGALSVVEEYDPGTDKWTRKGDMPMTRMGFALSEVNGKFYLMGGMTGKLNLSGAPTSAVAEYDPVADKWTRKADMLTARAGLVSAVMNGRIYAIGGSVTGPTAVAAVEEYDPVVDIWTKKPDMPTARLFSGIGEVDGKIYVIGGTPVYPMPVSLSIVEEYTPEVPPSSDSH